MLNVLATNWLIMLKFFLETLGSPLFDFILGNHHQGSSFNYFCRDKSVRTHISDGPSFSIVYDEAPPNEIFGIL